MVLNCYMSGIGSLDIVYDNSRKQEYVPERVGHEV